ncbi:MAG: hypothetical protein C0475_04295 [Planctomyces sp.]|nr:hypothetical protein [Planctomyces sp.]
MDYLAQADLLGPPPAPIVDIHAHINGPEASLVYDRARRAFGVRRVYSMTPISMAAGVRERLGDAIRFIAIPSWNLADRYHAHTRGYLTDIERFATEMGSRMLKLWCAPALRGYLGPDAPDIADIDSPWRREHCRLGMQLGMMFMCHVGDPDTWFATKYSDRAAFGLKPHVYVGLRRMLDLFPRPWIAAHMGGWPEDLDALDRLLEAHPNLHLDCSATRWIVRELSRHPRSQTAGFLTKWRTRVLFGSDIVALDDHLRPDKSTGSIKSDQANSPEAALDLYASRYWCLRTMFESTGITPSPVSDPDLAMVAPARHTPADQPRITGLGLPRDHLIDLYATNAQRLVESWWERS